jgi:hypothetical protein
MIFDEISMIGCTMIANMHLKLQILKSKIQQPFRNINIMFLGDFIQFPPIIDTLLLIHKTNSKTNNWQKHMEKLCYAKQNNIN